MEVETSSLGPSTFDGLSESSYDLHDHDSRSEASSFDEASNDEREGTHYDENRMEAEDAETPSISFMGGSYDLASSKLGSSVDTIQQGLDSMSSSQVRLIFPDPGLSFSSQVVSEADRTTFSSSRPLRSRAERPLSQAKWKPPKQKGEARALSAALVKRGKGQASFGLQRASQRQTINYCRVQSLLKS